MMSFGQNFGLFAKKKKNKETNEIQEEIASLIKEGAIIYETPIVERYDVSGYSIKDWSNFSAVGKKIIGIDYKFNPQNLMTKSLKDADLSYSDLTHLRSEDFKGIDVTGTDFTGVLFKNETVILEANNYHLATFSEPIKELYSEYFLDKSDDMLTQKFYTKSLKINEYMELKKIYPEKKIEAGLCNRHRLIVNEYCGGDYALAAKLVEANNQTILFVLANSRDKVKLLTKLRDDNKMDLKDLENLRKIKSVIELNEKRIAKRIISNSDNLNSPDFNVKDIVNNFNFLVTEEAQNEILSAGSSEDMTDFVSNINVLIKK